MYQICVFDIHSQKHINFAIVFSLGHLYRWLASFQVNNTSIVDLQQKFINQLIISLNFECYLNNADDFS